ncbi:hypothetical protein GobsT_63640 [Gemmata obscuriglobus]|uniref:Uncharacterized protein n=1 Tax=Gemmata obscuriglobus TaxID=114 RepID=A0A2Z3H2S0_9BACT|nr:hypothetical protein [Gemmata obscuriglobus]AWM35904.1 hypothetical protein C1280_02015 [Gemmata obscuriglobus]QEG31542.1 hypothetical protein GobsT_63640 [Gemmata obscuriglobus]VTS10884.1 unnamed protein product [Gemmata obscuriglobus UQM 2246]
MNLSLGLSLTSTRRRSGLVNPLAFLGAACYALLVAWMRANGLLWQDLARTIPAVSHLDPVRVAVWPFGPLGEVVFTAPSDAARPLLYFEGGLLWSLSFDGVDDCLVANANLPTPSGQAVTVGARSNRSIKSGGTSILYGSNAVGGDLRGHHVRSPPGSTGSGSHIYGAGGSQLATAYLTGDTTGANTIVVEYDNALSQTRISFNGGTPVVGNWVGAPFPTSNQLNIGAEAGLNNYLGRTSGFSLLSGSLLSAGTKSALEAYLGGL